MALKVAKICVFEVDLRRNLYTFFENSEDIFGVSGESILADVVPFSLLSDEEYKKAVSEYFSHPDDNEVVSRAFEQIFAGNPTTYQARMKAGITEFKWCKLDICPITENGEVRRMIGVITDISDLKQKTDMLEKLSVLDRFTGLYNRTYAEQCINNILASSFGQIHALVVIDLDNFKAINDTFGHSAGDVVLKSVADNLKKLFRKSDIIARFGGDEFIIFLKDIKGEQDLELKLSCLLQSDNRYNVTKSMGVALTSQNGESFSDLFKKADYALYRAKKIGNTYTIF